MAAITYGQPGNSLERSPIAGDASSSRRGAYFERRVAAAIGCWLSRRRDTVHVFHDLTGFNNVTGANLGSMDLGRSNIDHLLLTGRGWVMIDAKGCGAGRLTIDRHGKGILIDTAGTARPQPWMDDLHSYSRAGIVYRLTSGKAGEAVWVLPDETQYDDTIAEARFAQRGGTVLSLTELGDGALDELAPLAFPAPPASPADIARLCRHLSAPTT